MFCMPASAGCGAWWVPEAAGVVDEAWKMRPGRWGLGAWWMRLGGLMDEAW